MRKLLALAVLAFAVTAHAAPSEVAGSIKAEAPLGQATLTKMWYHVYDASLWTDAGQWSMAKPFALSLKYGMHFSTDDFVGRTLDEMKKAGATDDQAEAYKPLLQQSFPEVNKGDRITALYLPGNGTQFFFNGKPTGSVGAKAQPQFAKQFFAIWLAPTTSEPELRTQLLGQH